MAYAEAVAAKTIPVGRLARLACERFLRDLDAAKAKRGKWRFDPELAAKPILLAELMPNIKGPLAGTLLRLMPWQRWMMANLFGFVGRKDGKRRFRQASIWVPRGNGKTSLAAPLAIYMTFLEQEGGAEGYAAAVTRDQAKILWETAKQMVERTPMLRLRFGLQTSRNSVFQPSTASKFVAVSSDAKALDGLNVHVAVCDEIGSHKTANVYDVLLTALGKRDQPMLISISTATGNNAGIGKKLHDYTQRILEGTLTDERFFGTIYGADPEDSVWDETTWRKANPGWGVTVQPEAIRTIANQARQSPGQEIAFKTRHLNLWVSADHSLFLMEAWHRCADPTLRLADFEGRACYVGLDLSAKVDMTSASLVFPDNAPGEPARFVVFSRSWLPEATISTSRNASYPGWVADGSLTSTPGEVTDFEAIEDTLRDWGDRFDVQGVGYDPWSAKQLAQRMQNEGMPMVEIRQTVMNLSEPTKEFDALMRARRMRHEGNPVLGWSVSNVIGRYDEKGNVFPKKEKGGDGKIDAAMATLLGLTLATGTNQKVVHVTESPFMLL